MKKYFLDENKKIQFIAIACYILAATMLFQAIASLNKDIIRVLFSSLFFVLLYQAGTGMYKRRKSSRRLAIGLLLFFSLVSIIVLVDVISGLVDTSSITNSLIVLVIFGITSFMSVVSVFYIFTKSVKSEFNKKT